MVEGTQRQIDRPHRYWYFPYSISSEERVALLLNAQVIFLRALQKNDVYVKIVMQEADGNVMEYELVCSAFTVGNMTALVNDPTLNPLDEGRDVVRDNNCTVIEVQVGPW